LKQDSAASGSTKSGQKQSSIPETSKDNGPFHLVVPPSLYSQHSQQSRMVLNLRSDRRYSPSIRNVTVNKEMTPIRGNESYRSNVPREMTPIRRNESYVPREMTPIRGTESYVPREMAPIRGTESYVPREMAPIRGTESYVPREMAPIRRNESYVPREMTPIRGTESYRNNWTRDVNGELQLIFVFILEFRSTLTFF
jgi:hypothetical protein